MKVIVYFAGLTTKDTTKEMNVKIYRGTCAPISDEGLMVLVDDANVKDKPIKFKVASDNVTNHRVILGKVNDTYGVLSKACLVVPVEEADKESDILAIRSAVKTYYDEYCEILKLAAEFQDSEINIKDMSVDVALPD